MIKILFYLCHGREMIPDSRERRFFSHLEVDVDQFVRECGELVGEAGLVLARHFRRERVRVVLLFDLFVHLLAFGIGQQNVDIIMAPGHDLK